MFLTLCSRTICKSPWTHLLLPQKLVTVINLNLGYTLHGCILFWFPVWLGTVGLSVSLILTNVVSTVCQRKSPRSCAVVGGVICSLGVLLLSFSHKGDQLFIIYCGILSVGTGICLSTASIIVGRYFLQRRELAEMFVTCGTGLGTVVMAISIYGLNRWVVF